MKIETFELERYQSVWEHTVKYNLTESGIFPVTLNELIELGFDLNAAKEIPLGYSQTNGTPQLREQIAKLYPGAGLDNIEVVNGSSEANYVVTKSLLEPGDRFVFERPNFLQVRGVARNLKADVKEFQLRFDTNWEPDWDEFDQAVTPKTRAVYVSHPNNPSGKVLSRDSMKRIVSKCEEVGAYLISDEVYIGAELDRGQTLSFWGMSDRVIVTSSLSKSYGIPGIRIGWIVGPKEVVKSCWIHHDYITIGPNILSDLMAQTAVEKKNRHHLYNRSRKIIKRNWPHVQTWLTDMPSDLQFHKPDAGFFVFTKYAGTIPSRDLAEELRKNHSTLIAPGSCFEMENFIRLWIGGPLDYLEEGYRRLGAAFQEKVLGR